MNKRFISILLSIMMVLSLIPGSAMSAMVAYAAASQGISGGSAIELTRASGEGSTKLYHNFNEQNLSPTTKVGTTIAFFG